MLNLSQLSSRISQQRVQGQALRILHRPQNGQNRHAQREFNSIMIFHSGQYQFKVSFVIVNDFEALLQGSEEETDPDPISSYTRNINHHVPSGFCTYTIFWYGEVEDPLRLYRGKDCIEVF